MVVGTHVVLTGQYHWAALLASLVSFFLVNNLLLLNQYPDMDADRAVGRKTFPIAYGIGRSNLVYGLFLLLAAATIIVATALGQLPMLSLAALLPLLPGLAALRGAIRHGDDIEKLVPALGMNVATAVVTPLLLGITILMG
jgi:1,4-dihydroxy-2-naphthoate octaprenyltransferase